jgi:hypothetical protein
MLRFAPLLALAFVGCADRLGPPIHVVIAHGSVDERCAQAADDPPVTTAQVTAVRISVQKHAANQASGSFVCDTVLTAAGKPVSLTADVGDSPTIDLIAEGFRQGANGQVLRVATGSLLNLDVNAKTLPPLRLFPVETFRCVDARLGQARAFHSATALPGGEVLIFGGVVASGSDTTVETIANQQLFLTATVEVFDPSQGTFRALTVPSGALPRAFHSAALLDDAPPYHILIVGGATADAGKEAFTVNSGAPGPRLQPLDPSMPFAPPFPTHAAKAQLLVYTPPSTLEVMDQPGFMAASFSAAAALPHGVAVAGGIDWGPPNNMPIGVQLLEAEVQGEPSPRQVSTGPTVRLGATLTLLDSGDWLLWSGLTSPGAASGTLAQGLGEGASPTLTDLMQPTDVDATQFHAAAPVTVAGRPAVLVTGGFAADMTQVAIAPPTPDRAIRLLTVGVGAVDQARIAPASSTGDKRYDNDTTCTSAQRYRPAGFESAIAVRSDRVLVSGGAPASSPMCNDCDAGSGLLCSLKQASRFTAPSTFEPTVDPLQVGRFGHSSTVLSDGTVLIVGGVNQALRAGQPVTRMVGDAEIYNPRTLSPPFDGTIDADDPLAAELAASTLERAPGGVAHDHGSTAPAAACGSL